MFALLFCLQFSINSNIIRPNIREVSNGDEYPKHEPIRETTINIEVSHCLFDKIDYLEGNGGAILITTKKKVNCSVHDCKFNECKSKFGGAIYASYSEELNFDFSVTNSIFTSCECQKNGGAIYIQSAQPLYHTFNISGCTFNNNKATSGGALYAELRDQLTLENCKFNNNEAKNKGSSAYLKLGHENIKNTVEEHDTFNIHNNVFTFNPNSNNTVNVYVENDKITDQSDPAHVNVYFGGNTFTLDTTAPIEPTLQYLHLEIVENEGLFESFNFDSCNCVHQQQSTVKIAPNLELSNFNFGCTSIDTCVPNVITPTPLPTPDVDGYTPHDPIREVTLTIKVEKCKFCNLDNLDKDGGAILITSKTKVNCIVNDCKFIECKAANGGAIWAYYTEAKNYNFNVTNSVFADCECHTSGGAIYIKSAQPLKQKFNINGCTFNNNKATYGGALYAELRDQLTLENCNFNNNEASNKGSSAYLKLGHENIKNSVEEHDTFNIHNNVFVFSPKENNTINVYVESDRITDVDDPAHANVFFGGNTFSLDATVKAETTIEYLHFKIVENAGGFESFNFDSCNCVHQEQSTVNITSYLNVTSNLVLYNFNFGCTALDKCKSDQPTPPPTQIPTKPPTPPGEDDYTQHEPIRETTINIDVKGCLFDKIDYSEGNGGAILITTKKKVNVSVTDCKFNQCSAGNGGAVWAFYSATVDYEFNIINTIFIGCTCQTRGGAIYIQSAQPLYHTFNITGCTFNNNKATYGGALYAELRDQLTIENCNFNNNEASNKGSSAYLKLGHENIKNSVVEHDTFNIHNNVFTFNPSSNNKINVFIENDEITDQSDPAHANVFFGGNTFNIESSSSVSTSDYLHLSIKENIGGFESFNFDSCNCVHQQQNTVNITSSIRLYNFNFGCTSVDKCTSDQPTVLPTEPPTPDTDGFTPHEPIKETSTKIELTKNKFNSMGSLDKDGGAILISFSRKVSCSINNCKFNDCKAKNGGAISASYSSAVDYAFKITQTSFSGCQADSNGGSVYIKSAQPLHHTFDIIECTFSNNKAYNGGALYAELRDQLVLENCNFNNNEATLKGSNAYLKLGHENIKNSVEEHDTFKIHGNTFLLKPGTAEVVGLYIENDEITDTTDPPHANVYFGGNTFDIEGSRVARSDYLHLEVVENEGGFESFTFDSCNCVKQGRNTVKVENSITLNNFNFECTSIESCKSNVDEIPASLSSSSVSNADKDIDDNESNRSNKSKVGLTIGIAVAAVVVVALIVVVVLIVLRKKLTGNNVHDLRTDDIADNLNEPSGTSELNKVGFL